MVDEKKPTGEVHQPFKRGYQPEKQPTTPSEPAPKSGYQPTTSEGDNPANEPSPPKEE